MSATIFRRRIYNEMLRWKSRGTRSALLIEGARRVGKSTIVREFAKREFKTALIIDFNRPLDGTVEAFEKYGSDSSKLFSALQMIYGVRLYKGRSLVVFDEVQHYPPARALIKYFVEEGDYMFIETGSLISIRQNVKDIQIPSEEYRIQMNPMGFDEFLWAIGDDTSMGLIKDAFDRREPLGQIPHRIIMDRFRTYLMVGGMPQAVDAYVRTKDMMEVEDVKREIIQLYRDDMMKITRGNGIYAGAVFEQMPSLLSNHKKVFMPGIVMEGLTTSDFDVSMDWLVESRICNRCSESNDPNPAMNMSLDRSRFKCYLLDTGLLLSLAFDRGNLSREDTQVAFLNGKLSINEGMLFENVVAQMMVAEGIRLYFHEFYMKDDDKHMYEVDFVMARGNKVVPVEVKSSQSARHASLDYFMEKYRNVARSPVIIHPRDLRVDGDITYLPVYMVPFLSGIE